MVAVGEVDHVIKQICEEARRLIPGKTLGPVITAEAKTRIENYITEILKAAFTPEATAEDNDEFAIGGTEDETVPVDTY